MKVMLMKVMVDVSPTSGYGWSSGAACNAGARGWRPGNALRANINTCIAVDYHIIFSPAGQLTSLAVTTVFLMGSCVAVWLVVLSAIVQLPSSEETIQL